MYEQIAEKLGLTGKYGKVVNKPTAFINNHSENEPVDEAFVDEAHLLLTQGKQSYRGENQLEDIIDRVRVTIVMFDENQILKTEQFWETQILEQYRNLAKSIVIEAAELLECFQWSDEGYDLQHIKEELADVMVYSQNLLDKLDLDADEIVNMKMTMNEAKYPVEKAKGRADKYDQL